MWKHPVWGVLIMSIHVIRNNGLTSDLHTGSSVDSDSWVHHGVWGNHCQAVPSDLHLQEPYSQQDSKSLHVHTNTCISQWFLEIKNFIDYITYSHTFIHGFHCLYKSFSSVAGTCIPSDYWFQCM